MKLKGYAKSTLVSYTHDVKDFLLFLSKHFNESVSLKVIQNAQITDIRAWITDRATCRKYNNSSSSRAISAVRSFCKFLRQHKKCEFNAIFEIKTLKKPRRLPRGLSHNDIETIMSSAKDNIFENPEWVVARNKALIALLYATGLRISEALRITKHHLSMDYIHITGKGKKDRIIPWIPYIKGLVNHYIELLPYTLNDNNCSIFLGMKGKSLSPAVFSRNLIQLRFHYNLPKHLSAHSFRHTFATHLLENGVNIRAIQELLGHANISSTEIYTNINTSFLKQEYLKAHPIS